MITFLSLGQLKCFHKKTHGMDSVYRCQFPSAIVKDDHRLVYRKTELDDAFKDKRFSEDIKVELLFSQGDESNGDGTYMGITLPGCHALCV
jgi:hypothetical protein